MPPRAPAQARFPIGPEPPPPDRLAEAMYRLDRERVLSFLVTNALSPAELKKLLAGRLPRTLEKEVPPELYGQLAVGVGRDEPEFDQLLAEALHDRLAWDREPADPAGWERRAHDKPLEALWMAAVSETKAVKKGFPRFADECKRLYRSSPACQPPTWELFDASTDLTSELSAKLDRAEKEIEDASRRLAGERQRIEELREELRKLRRENSDLRAEKADAARRLSAAAERERAGVSPSDRARIEELERRLRKTEKEREHLKRLLERKEERAAERPAAPGAGNGSGTAAAPGPTEAEVRPANGAALSAEDSGAFEIESLAGLPPRSRVLRQMLRKLLKKRKIGAAHTHEDNVYRGIPDHEKGLAKEAMELLYREGIFQPKTTVADPHVSIAAERVGEVQELIAGRVASPRLAAWLSAED
jgi:hypothetical protein